jgi:hypothetical protein
MADQGLDPSWSGKRSQRMGSLSSSVGTRTGRWSVFLVVAALLFVGCGGSESDEAGPTTGTQPGVTTGEAQAPSKQEYIAQGDAVCADIQTGAARLAQQAEDLQAQNDELSKEVFLAKAAQFWQGQIRLIEDFLERFEGLGSPSGDEAQVERLLTSIEDGIAKAREIQETLAGGEEVPEALVEEYGQTVVRGNELARAYGFQVCGQSQ